MGSTPVQAWSIFRLYFHYYSSRAHNCDDHWSAVHIYAFIYSHSILGPLIKFTNAQKWRQLVNEIPASHGHHLLQIETTKDKKANKPVWTQRSHISQQTIGRSDSSLRYTFKQTGQKFPALNNLWRENLSNILMPISSMNCKICLIWLLLNIAL